MRGWDGPRTRSCGWRCGRCSSCRTLPWPVEQRRLNCVKAWRAHVLNHLLPAHGTPLLPNRVCRGTHQPMRTPPLRAALQPAMPSTAKRCRASTTPQSPRRSHDAELPPPPTPRPRSSRAAQSPPPRARPRPRPRPLPRPRPRPLPRPRPRPLPRPRPRPPGPSSSVSVPSWSISPASGTSSPSSSATMSSPSSPPSPPASAVLHTRHIQAAAVSLLRIICASSVHRLGYHEGYRLQRLGAARHMLGAAAARPLPSARHDTRASSHPTCHTRTRTLTRTHTYTCTQPRAHLPMKTSGPAWPLGPTAPAATSAARLAASVPARSCRAASLACGRHTRVRAKRGPYTHASRADTRGVRGCSPPPSLAPTLLARKGFQHHWINPP
jgi:hypothetical protein